MRRVPLERVTTPEEPELDPAPPPVGVCVWSARAGRDRACAMRAAPARRDRVAGRREPAVALVADDVDGAADHLRAVLHRGRPGRERGDRLVCRLHRVHRDAAGRDGG